MVLSELGKKVKEYWEQIPDHFPFVRLDIVVVMPNHLHGILILKDPVGARYIVPLQKENFGKPSKGSIPTIIRTYKAAVTRGVHKTTIWQRSYYDHIIRDELELTRIRQYIHDNPLRWYYDKENPGGKPDEQESTFWVSLENSKSVLQEAVTT